MKIKHGHFEIETLYYNEILINIKQVQHYHDFLFIAL